MKQWFVLVNPAAGGWKVKKLWPEIERSLNDSSISFISHITQSAISANSVIAEAISNGYKNFIAVGGDGTLNLLANGIFNNNKNNKEIVLGIIPVGTGNDWIKTHHIPNNILKAIEIIKIGKTVSHDIGKIELSSARGTKKQYFINIAGGAFDGFVANRIEHHALTSRKNILVYVRGIFEGLFKYPVSRLKIEMDDIIIEDKIFCVNIGICKFSGGGMKMTPDAIFDDGLFDITIVRDISRFDVILNVPGLFNGKFIRHRKIEQYRAKTVYINSTSAIPFEADGEIIGDGNITIEIIPQAINLVVK